MKAAVHRRYGPPEVVTIEQVPTPTPGPRQVLVRIHATTVTMGDCEVRAFSFPPSLWLPVRLYMGLLRPRIRTLGMELAGVVEAVGSAVTRFAVGDRVLGATEASLGAHAEHICLPQSGSLAAMPEGLSFEDAAAIPIGGLDALHFLRKAEVQPGDRVLVNGAGGTIGTFAVQLAKRKGATVTAVDRGGKLEMLRSIGADAVIDYTREALDRHGDAYDVVFDVVGRGMFSRCLAVVAPRGRYVLANPGLLDMLRALWVSMTSRRRMVLGAAEHRAEDLADLAQQVAEGVLSVVVDRRFALEEIAEAHRYVDSGRKQGSVVVTVVPAQPPTLASTSTEASTSPTSAPEEAKSPSITSAS